MKLTIEIDLDNAAFDDSPSDEARRILNDAIDRIELTSYAFAPISLYDANGNYCGVARITE